MKERHHPLNANHMRHKAEHRAQGGPGAGWAALGVLTFLVAIVLAWALAFLVTNWLYGQISLHPAEIVRQIVTALAGLLFLALPAGVIGALHRPNEVAAFRSILMALQRIARGDFRTRVQAPLQRLDHPYNQLVHSINDMAEELGRMEALRQEFISNVSHEIRSPLTSIRGFAKALQDDRLDPAERRRYLEVIETESERLSRMSDNLLRLAALEADQTIQAAPYRLDRQLQRVLLAAEPQWSAKQIEVEAELQIVEVVGDEALLNHVWTNLLHNAVKFTPAGGRIAIRMRQETGEAIVEVEDTGIGISAEDQRRIFERFYKADPARVRTDDGSGLGLALAKLIAELHGGSIRVTSTPGHGATFSVALPGARN